MLNEAAILKPGKPPFKVTGVKFPARAVLLGISRTDLEVALPKPALDALKKTVATWERVLSAENLSPALGNYNHQIIYRRQVEDSVMSR
eukprot:721231-Prorocentrum_minimum.AAC.1